MITLVLDASTYVGSVAVLGDREVAGFARAAMRGRDAERLMPAVAEALQLAGRDVADVDRVVCGAGPGSFTSLRIAASIAKGIALGRGVPLYRVPSLGLAIEPAEGKAGERNYLVALDALRGDSYVQSFRLCSGRLESIGQVERVSSAEVARKAQLLEATLVVAGEEDIWPDARRARYQFDAIAIDGPMDVGLWEPDYGRPAEAQARWESHHGRPIQG